MLASGGYENDPHHVAGADPSVFGADAAVIVDFARTSEPPLGVARELTAIRTPDSETPSRS